MLRKLTTTYMPGTSLPPLFKTCTSTSSVRVFWLIEAEVLVTLSCHFIIRPLLKRKDGGLSHLNRRRIGLGYRYQDPQPIDTRNLKHLSALCTSGGRTNI